MTIVLNALLEMTVFSVVLFTAILLFQKMFRRRISAAMGYAVWALLILRLMIPVTIDSGFHMFTVPQQQTVQTVYSDETSDVSHIETPSVLAPVSQLPEKHTAITQPAETIDSTTKHASHTTATSKPIDWSAMIMLIWVIGALGFFSHTSIQWIQLSRKMKRSDTDAPAFINDMINACKKDLDIHANIKISIQDWLISPALSASLKPTLLLPKSMLEKADTQELAFGIRHELTHFKRKDHVVSLLLMALRCVHWFNPVVWLAFRRIQADMETACDAAVTARMTGNERTRYIHTMIDMGSGAKPLYALGMGCGQGRKALEKRVRGIFMTKRTKPTARLAAGLLSLLLFVACFTTACQPTPEEPVVVNKNEGVLEAAVAATPAPTTGYEAPDTWQDVIQRDGSKIKLDIDASINLPDVNAYPVMRIAPIQFSQEQADRIVSVLFKDADVYNSSKPLTKVELEQQLVEAKATLGQKKIDPQSNDDSEEGIQQTIDYLEQAILTAPEEMDDQLASTLLQPDKYGEIRLDLKADMGKKENATLWLMNGGENVHDSLTCFARFVNTDSGGLFNRLDEWNLSDDLPSNLSISEDEAVAQAKRLISDLGVTNMDIAAISHGIISGGEGEDVSQNPQCYMIYFTRTVSGVPTTFGHITGYGSAIDVGDIIDGNYPPDYRPPWNYESILVCVDDSGIVEIDWESPVKLLGTASENVSLAPFNEIQDEFKKQMFVKYSNIEYDKLLAEITYHVSKITLGLTRVASKDDLNEYLLIPVWNFFGSYQEQYNIDAIPEQFKDSDKETIIEVKKDYEQHNNQIRSRPYESFLTISAIDGSVIDPYVGY